MPVFDGTNIWVPNFESESVSVVRASTGAVLATLTGLSGAWAAAFDGQYVAVTSLPNDTITVFKAADLSLVQSSFLLGSNPAGICSDGIQFWVAFSGASEIARY
jgi:DNA-binding beta-propeller fold protein YncE